MIKEMHVHNRQPSSFKKAEKILVNKSDAQLAQEEWHCHSVVSGV
jgi:hypothetical protein